MCISLIFSDTLFLVLYVIEKITSVCYPVAMVLHWTMLNSQMWVLIICFDIGLIIHLRVSACSRNKVKIFSRYFLVTCLVPLVFVAMAVSLNEAGYELGYKSSCAFKAFHGSALVNCLANDCYESALDWDPGKNIGANLHREKSYSWKVQLGSIRCERCSDCCKACAQSGLNQNRRLCANYKWQQNLQSDQFVCLQLCSMFAWYFCFCCFHMQQKGFATL